MSLAPSPIPTIAGNPGVSRHVGVLLSPHPRSSSPSSSHLCLYSSFSPCLTSAYQVNNLNNTCTELRCGLLRVSAQDPPLKPWT